VESGSIRISFALGTGLALLACPLAAQPAGAPGGERYFYRGLSYGSDAAFHPVSEVVNGAFGILQISSNWVPLDEIDFERGLEVTWESITNPVRTVDEYGRSDFVTDELVPGKLDWSNLQYVPNYCLHLIGGGARHRAFAEWYGAHDFPVPALWAWGTTILHAFAVESVEHHARTAPTVDPVADMYVFDPAGALLFTSDTVARFFSRTLNMAIWSGQPAYNPVANTFENAGQNYGLHLFLRDSHRVGLFSYWGMSHLFGVTVRGGSLFDWSLGVGGAVDELYEQDRGNGTSSLAARVKLDAGAFVHRNGSLLASVQVSQAWAQTFRAAIYPGWFNVSGLSPGLYTGVRGEDVIVGVSFSRFPIGLAASR
jgi:hypothetical protein